MRTKVTEAEIIARIRRLAGSEPPDVILGIGDDAAILRSEKSHLRLLTTDLLVEGIHFDRAYASLYDIGRKAMAVNLSDIAAMGGRPRLCVLGLAVPSPGPGLVDLVRGIVDEARTCGVYLAGGDLSATPGRMILAITLEGTCRPGRVVRRSGAMPGDGLYLLGTPGRSSLGLELLTRGCRLRGRSLSLVEGLASLGRQERSAARRAIRAHVRPKPLVEQGWTIAQAGVASAMIDTSDGISRDIRNLCRESGVGAEVDSQAFRPGPGEHALAARLGLSWESLALHGGEDYGLLFSVPPRRVGRLGRLSFDAVSLARVGTVLPDRAKILKVDGSTRCPLEDGGFDHLTHKRFGCRQRS